MKLDLAGAAKAVQMLGLLADYFDGGGAPWTKWVHTDDDGGRCLIGAMDLLRKRHRLYGNATRYYLLEAAGRPWHTLVGFNDYGCRDVPQLLDVMRRARRLAAADIEQHQPARRAA